MAGVFGAATGSFCNVIIVRLPRGESVALPRSHCRSCGAHVRPYDNIPILSYLLLRGRCRACRAPISPRYLFVEALGALLGAVLWWELVANDPGQSAGVRIGRFACYFAFGIVLLALSFIDLATKLLPDVITLPAIPIFYLAAFAAHEADWLERLIGAAAGYLFFRLIADFYFYVLKREGLGLGDGKLLALIGAVLGWRALPFVVFVGATAGALVSIPVLLVSRRRSGAPAEPLRQTQIPFGPFLALAALVYLCAGRRLLELWLGG